MNSEHNYLDATGPDPLSCITEDGYCPPADCMASNDPLERLTASENTGAHLRGAVEFEPLVHTGQGDSSVDYTPTHGLRDLLADAIVIGVGILLLGMLAYGLAKLLT